MARNVDRLKRLRRNPLVPYFKEMTDASPPPRPWRRLDDFALAFVFLTRLPLRLPGAPPDGALARSMTWFPIVGAAVGVFGGSVYALAHFAGLSAASAALLALAATVWVTGALHEDGLADTFDGLGGGRDRARKLAIMHDSRIGSYGALALLFSVGLRASALVAIAVPWTVLAAMVAAGSLSRVVAPVLAALLPPARTDGLGFLCGRHAARRLRLSASVLSSPQARADLERFRCCWPERWRQPRPWPRSRSGRSTATPATRWERLSKRARRPFF